MPASEQISRLGKHEDHLPPDPGWRRWSAIDAVASSLILLTPFIVFINHNNYPLLAPETVMACGGIALFGGGLGFAGAIAGRITRGLLIAFLITLFIDIQFDFYPVWGLWGAGAFAAVFFLTWILGHHASRILSVVFVTVLVSSLVLQMDGNAPKEQVQTRSTVVNNNSDRDLPVLVYLILDEHIGIEGIPSDLNGGPEIREKIVSFYVSNGFRLFGRTYSEYINTRDSLSHIMNFSPSSYNENLVSQIGKINRWKMKDNKLLRKIASNGYEIHVFQTSHLNFCEVSEIAIELCQTGSFTSLEPLSRTNHSSLEKIRVILTAYSHRSFLYKEFKSYVRRVKDFARGLGISFPPIEWGRVAVGTLMAMKQLDDVRNEVANAAPGEAYIAHVLLPHYPYVYASDCAVQKTKNWLKNKSESAPVGMTNTIDSRSIRYGAYLEQVECVMSRLQGIFDGMREAGTYQDALIIIQGDHGSRISLVAPTVESIDRLADSDFLDTFSTLFAVKAPAIEPGYDRSVRSVQELATSWATADFRALPDRVDDDGQAWVFLPGQASQRIRHPLRVFDVNEP